MTIPQTVDDFSKEDLIKAYHEMNMELDRLREENAQMSAEIRKWQRCHRQDLEDNLRLRNQVAILMGWDTE